MTVKKNSSTFSLRQRWRSIGYAWVGLLALFSTQANARFHLAAAILVISAGLILGLTVDEWMIITFCIGLVIAFEAVNTAIEFLADRVTGQQDEQIKRVKDVSAAAVLIVSITVAIQAGLIFIPYIAVLL
jgi:diacylglycerol kinase